MRAELDEAAGVEQLLDPLASTRNALLRPLADRLLPHRFLGDFDVLLKLGKLFRCRAHLLTRPTLLRAKSPRACSSSLRRSWKCRARRPSGCGRRRYTPLPDSGCRRPATTVGGAVGHSRLQLDRAVVVAVAQVQHHMTVVSGSRPGRPGTWPGCRSTTCAGARPSPPGIFIPENSMSCNMIEICSSSSGGGEFGDLLVVQRWPRRCRSCGRSPGTAAPWPCGSPGCRPRPAPTSGLCRSCATKPTSAPCSRICTATSSDMMPPSDQPASSVRPVRLQLAQHREVLLGPLVERSFHPLDTVDRHVGGQSSQQRLVGQTGAARRVEQEQRVRVLPSTGARRVRTKPSRSAALQMLAHHAGKLLDVLRVQHVVDGDLALGPLRQPRGQLRREPPAVRIGSVLKMPPADSPVTIAQVAKVSRSAASRGGTSVSVADCAAPLAAAANDLDNLLRLGHHGGVRIGKFGLGPRLPPRRRPMRSTTFAAPPAGRPAPPPRRDARWRSAAPCRRR